MAAFRVTTWNVENLFDVGDGDGPETQAQLASKLRSLAAVIDEQEPQVVALQEIGSESVLGSGKPRSINRCATGLSKTRTTVISACIATFASTLATVDDGARPNVTPRRLIR